MLSLSFSFSLVFFRLLSFSFLPFSLSLFAQLIFSYHSHSFPPFYQSHQYFFLSPSFLNLSFPLRLIFLSSVLYFVIVFLLFPAPLHLSSPSPFFAVFQSSFPLCLISLSSPVFPIYTSLSVLVFFHPHSSLHPSSPFLIYPFLFTLFPPSTPLPSANSSPLLCHSFSTVLFSVTSPSPKSPPLLCLTPSPPRVFPPALLSLLGWTPKQRHPPIGESSEHVSFIPSPPVPCLSRPG